MIDEAIARLKSRQPDLKDRVYGAGALAALLAKTAMPEVTPVAYVVPMGFRSGKEAAVSGAYLQTQEAILGVMLCLRSNDRNGQRALDSVQSFLTGIPLALAGWRAPTSIGACRPVRAFLAASREGTMWWQFEFSIPTQIRTDPS